MINKVMTVDEIVAELRDGMSIGLGGWATRRKPMALVRAIARSSLKDLTVIAGYGGPDVGLLAATGKIRKLIFSFVTLDHIPLDPHYRAAREKGAFQVWEVDEGMFHWGLRAAAMKLPFLPTRVGIGTDVINQPGFKMITSPYQDEEELVAMPPITPDVALIHAHRSDDRGNILNLSVDPIFDELLVRASERSYVTVEKIVSTAALDMKNNSRFNLVERTLITGVAEVAFGAHPTSGSPDYEIDLDHLRLYSKSARSVEQWDDYKNNFIDVDEASYLSAVGGPSKVSSLPKPIY